MTRSSGDMLAVLRLSVFPWQVLCHAHNRCTLRLRGRFLTTTRILGRLGSSGGSTTGARAASGDMGSADSRRPLCWVPACSATPKILSTS